MGLFGSDNKKKKSTRVVANKTDSLATLERKAEKLKNDKKRMALMSQINVESKKVYK